MTVPVEVNMKGEKRNERKRGLPGFAEELVMLRSKMVEWAVEF